METTKTVSAPPATGGGPASSRRGVRIALAVLGALVVAGMLVWSLAPGVLVRMAPASLDFRADAPATYVEGFDETGGTYVVGYQHETYTGTTVTLHNRGPVPVRVTDVELATEARPLFEQMADGADGATIGAGERVEIPITLRFDNCEYYHERAIMRVTEVAVQLEMLGRSFVTTVPLDHQLAARSPMLSSCPDRTLDRQDDTRSDG